MVYDAIFIKLSKLRKNDQRMERREKESEKRDLSFLGQPRLRRQLCCGFSEMRFCQQLHIIQRQADQQSPLRLQNTAIE